MKGASLTTTTALIFLSMPVGFGQSALLCNLSRFLPFLSRFCDDPCDDPDPPCENNGICIPVVEENGGSSEYRCECPVGFTGTYCEASTVDAPQLCPPNIPVTVTIGASSNPSGVFVNVPLNQSLANVVNCLDPNEGETHTQESHVWWNPAPLELVFEFDSSYFLTEVLFWNYFGESYDVDQIDLVFYTSSGDTVGRQTVLPILGRNSDGQNTNDIIAERIALNILSFPVKSVSATLLGTNGQLDFQNFVFLGIRALN